MCENDPREHEPRRSIAPLSPHALAVVGFRLAALRLFDEATNPDCHEHTRSSPACGPIEEGTATHSCDGDPGATPCDCWCHIFHAHRPGSGFRAMLRNLEP